MAYCSKYNSMMNILMETVTLKLLCRWMPNLAQLCLVSGGNVVTLEKSKKSTLGPTLHASSATLDWATSNLTRRFLTYVVICDVNNGRSSDMSDYFYAAIEHLKIEMWLMSNQIFVRLKEIQLMSDKIFAQLKDFLILTEIQTNYIHIQSNG